MGCHFLLQGIFPTQGSNPGLPHCGQTLYCPSHQGLITSKWKITDSALKIRDTTLPVKAMVFRVVTYGCESWTVMKAEGRRIDAFQLWCWRSPRRVPWTVRGSSKSILREISPEYSLKGQMLKLNTEDQYFGHLM